MKESLVEGGVVEDQEEEDYEYEEEVDVAGEYVSQLGRSEVESLFIYKERLVQYNCRNQSLT